MVSRIVASAFLYNEDKNKCWIGFRDSKRSNCRADNLFFMDRSYARAVSGHTRPVILLKNGKELRRFPSARIAAEATDVKEKRISNLCRIGTDK